MSKISELELKDITKSFQGHKANDGVNLKVRSGEIIGLLGENGAGKTTLMNILMGLYRPDAGSVVVNGEKVIFHTPRDAIRIGIGMVHQHFMLVQKHTIAENVAMGWEKCPLFFPHRKVSQAVRDYSQQFGLDLDPDKKVWLLSAGEQQRVEIVKTLIYGADVLILDEPTSVLTPQEAEELFVVIRRMAKEGKAVILISHKLDEILSVCHRVEILRKGQNAGGAPMGELSKEDLARLMVGREIHFTMEKNPTPPGASVLKVENLTVVGDQGLPSVQNCSLEIHEGEILGIAGVAGNGQRELVETITGLRRPLSGHVVVKDRDITGESARVISSLGISHVPEERIKFGIVPNLFIYENSVLKSHHGKPFTDVIFMDYGLIRDHAENIVDHFQISAPSIHVPMKNLSGGNIQKLIIGREILNHPALLVASHPTYGLDVGATEYIRSQLLKRREEGGAVLLVSEDLEELMNLSDRIAVMFQGRIMGVVDPRVTPVDQIGLMMAGSRPEVSL